MPEINLTQDEANALLSMDKVRTSGEQHIWNGGKLELPLISKDGHEHFFLNINKARIELNKGTYQTRARCVIILVRLDFGPNLRHVNPDGQWVEGPHLHIYKEGFADKWATPVTMADPGTFTHIDDFWLTLQQFMGFCHITEPPRITKGLFA